MHEYLEKRKTKNKKKTNKNHHLSKNFSYILHVDKSYKISSNRRFFLEILPKAHQPSPKLIIVQLN